MRRVDEIAKSLHGKIGLINAAYNSSDPVERRVARAFLFLGRTADGGEGSGNHNHRGVPGQRGGSAPSGGEGASSGGHSVGGLDVSHIENMGKFHDALKKSAQDCYGSEEGIDKEVRSEYRREMRGLFDYEGNPYDFANKVDSMEEYVQLPWGDRVSSYVEYDTYKEYVLKHSPWEYAEPGSICDTLIRYNRGANPNGYGKGKGMRLAFDKETGLSDFIDKHPDLHYNGGTVYRGVESNKAGIAALQRAMKNDEPISMRGPSSWTTKERVADDFSKNSLRSTGRGTKIIFYEEGNKKRNAIPFPYSMAGIGGQQYEVLYSGNTQFKVKSMEERGDTLYVRVESEE